jgi:hypothetical protein
MKRRLLTHLSALSLLLCVVTCGLWARSMHRYDLKQRTLESWMNVNDHSMEAVAHLMVIPEESVTDSWYEWQLLNSVLTDQKTERARIAAELRTPYSRRSFAFYSIAAALTAMAPAFLSARWAGRRILAGSRQRRNCCPTCGYDLRATPNRCPECGTETKTLASHADKARPGSTV